MPISNILSFKQFLSRSYSTFNLSQKMNFKNEKDDNFALSTNLLGDSVEFLLKSISHLLNGEFITGHKYENILTNSDNNKYGISSTLTKINKNKYFDGKLLHEFKYADDTTTISERRIKEGSYKDFYKTYSINEYNDLKELYKELQEKTLIAYEDINKININIKNKIDLNQDLLNSIKELNNQINKLFNMYSKEISNDYSDIKFFLKLYFDNCFKFIDNCNILMDKEDFYEYDYYNIIKEIINIPYIDYWLEENSKNDIFINKINNYTNILENFNEYTKIKFMIQ